jgi:hypothetical protein
MEHAHRIEVPLVHQVEVGKATQVLLHHLDCDGWYVACHREHQYVYHLTRHGADKYAVCFQCTPPVEKGIYHGSKAWALSVIPLHGVEPIAEAKLQQLFTAFERTVEHTEP